MPDTILGGDFTVYYAAENNRKAIQWTGSATGTRTLNELYSALQNLFDDAAQMDDVIPMKADTPDIYRMQNNWFIDDTTVEHLTGGSLFSDGWIVGGTEHILVIGYAQTTEFLAADIGRTIRGGTTGDTGTILDFNTSRQLVLIRPVDPLAAGDEFDNGTEAYTIGAALQGDPFAEVVVEEDGVAFAADETADANSAGNNDWQIFSDIGTEGTNDYVALGFAIQFTKVTFDNLNGVQGVDGGALATVWEYWNGTIWASLAGVTDGTSEFTAAVADGQDLTFTIPTDWALTSLDGGAQLYFIRLRITAGDYSTNPVYDQGFISGVGAGIFQTDTRHGTGSAAGEAAWAGITTIGTIEANTHIYIFAEDPGVAAGSFNEIKVIATKGASDWWADGAIDILLKVKEAASLFGQLPGSSPATAVATVLARQYSKLYSHFIANALATAGGNTVVPLSTADDANNTSGHRSMLFTDSAGNWNVDDRIVDDTDTTIQGVITSVSGSNPTITLEYYLIGDPLNDFTGATGTLNNQDDTGTATATAPSDVGPASDAGITIVFGATTLDLNNGNGAQPYSILIDPNSVAINRLYERTKFVSRRGSVITLQSQDGEEYVGTELQIEYDTQTGNFAEGLILTGGTSGAQGRIVADHDDGANGDLIVKEVRGTFVDNETITDSATGSADILAAGGIRTVTPVSAAPFGTFAGGSFFGAPGVALITGNLIAGDVQAFQLIDDEGVTQIPPNTVSVEVTNLVSGDTVAVFRRTGSAINKTQFTLAAGNNQGDTTVVMDGAIPADNPTVANSKVRVISASGEEHRYRYDSYASATFTLAPASTGTATAGSTTTLTDSGATFQTDEVEVGDYVRNTTDDFFVRVVAVVSETELTTETAPLTWNAKVYTLNTLVENYGLQSAYVPYIERIADATSENNQLVHTTDIDVRVEVRNAGVILPFTQDSDIVSTGRSVAAVRNVDDIFT